MPDLSSAMFRVVFCKVIGAGMQHASGWHGWFDIHWHVCRGDIKPAFADQSF